MYGITFRDLKKVAYEQIADPKILAPTDAIVKVHLTAVCGSDLHVFHGRECGLDCGTVMGHEFVGEVLEVGKEVNKLKKGMKVASPFTTSCGVCYFCTSGLTARCVHSQLYGWVQNGKGLHGGQAEYVRVPMADASLYVYDDSVSDRQALLAGDVLSTGFFCAEMANIRPERVYVVIGCGPVGLMAVLGAKHFGAEQVYAIDQVPERLEMAQKLGGIPLALDQNPWAKIQEITKGIGADGVLEAVGSKRAGQLAFELVRPGGIISTVGVHTSPNFAFSPAQAYDKNLTYRIGRCPARHYMERLMPKMQELPFDPSVIVSHEMSLSKGVEAYDLFDAKQDGVLKVVLRP